jgi:penicillin-binding protein 1A
MSMRRRPAWRRLLRKSLRIAVILVMGIPIFVVTAGAVGIATLVYGNVDGAIPKPRPAPQLLPSKVFVVNENGVCCEQIAEFREFEITAKTKREDIPQVLKDAVVASEDHQFWTHRGVDPLGIARAAQANFTSGETVQGGSTITQQLVRDRYLTRERTTERKFNEVLLATRFERDLADEVTKETGLEGDAAEHEAKERILFDYLTSVYFGAGAYGVGAAAQTYFHKDVKDLNAAEAATIVAVIPAPSKYGPRENITVAEQRRKDVLTEMHELQRHDVPQVDGKAPPMLTDDEYKAALDLSLWYAGFGMPPKPLTVIFPPATATYAKYPFYVDYIRLYLLDKYGPDQLYHGGLTIVAAIDPRLQAMAEQAVGNTLSGTAAPLEMSLVSVEPSTGMVKALVGGRDWNQSQVNLALGGSTGMQPGSSFKPFTAAKALEEGYSPETQYFAPGVLNVAGCTGVCAIRGGTGGIETMRSAVAASINTYFAQLILDLGPDNVAELANRLGVTRITLPAHTPDGHYNLGLTLGAFEVSPLDMAAGFSVFANHGIKPGATPVAKITDATGEVLEDNTAPHGKRVLNAAVADTVAEMMRGPIESPNGTAHGVVRLGRMAAGKTGTAQEYRAAWFVGYVPQLATSVWMGYSDSSQRSLRNIKGVAQVFGGTWPARTWNAFMNAALQGVPEIKFPVPGPLPPPSSGIRHIPRDAEIPDFPLDCDGPCLVEPTLTTPTTEPPSTLVTGEDCGDHCPDRPETTTTTRPRTGAPVTTFKPPVTVKGSP